MILRNTQAGSALLETMIALLVMAMIAVMMSGVMGSGVRVLARSAALGDDVEQALHRRDTRLWLEHAIMQPVSGAPRAGFVGTQTGLKAQVIPPSGAFWPGMVTILTLEYNSQVTAEGQDAAGRPVLRQMQLAPDGQKVSLLYWGRRAANQDNTWYSDWPAEAALPSLVKITFVGPGRPVPPLTIRPAKAELQSEMSLSSLVPPALPSAP